MGANITQEILTMFLRVPSPAPGKNAKSAALDRYLCVAPRGPSPYGVIYGVYPHIGGPYTIKFCHTTGKLSIV